MGATSAQRARACPWGRVDEGGFLAFQLVVESAIASSCNAGLRCKKNEYYEALLSTKAVKKFEKELEIWLDENISLKRQISAALASKINVLRQFKFRWLSLPYHLVVMSLSASGPAIAYHTSGAVSLRGAIFGFIFIWLLLFVCQALNAWSDAKAKRVTGPLQTIWVRIGDLLNTVKSSATAAKDKDNSIEAALAIAVSISAEIAQVGTERIAASLVQYKGTGFGKMTVTHRNRGSERPVQRPVKKIETLLGHHACQRGAAPRVVADIRRFGPIGLKSPTQTKHQYRSLLIYPLLSSPDQKPKGFISIDCTVAHAFHGHLADDLVALLEPIKAHIEDMI